MTVSDVASPRVVFPLTFKLPVNVLFAATCKVFTNAVPQFKAELPKFLALFVEGSRFVIALALKLTVSVLASPKVVFP